MNNVVLMGRLTRDPEVRYSQGENPIAIARYTIAVDRRFKREGQPEADFISCISVGKAGEFVEKYFRQGMRVCVQGSIQTGSYTNKEGQKVYTTDVYTENVEFAQSRNEGNAPVSGAKAASNPAPAPAPQATAGDGFMNIPDGIDCELPFN